MLQALELRLVHAVQVAATADQATATLDTIVQPGQTTQLLVFAWFTGGFQIRLRHHQDDVNVTLLLPPCVTVLEAWVVRANHGCQHGRT